MINLVVFLGNKGKQYARTRHNLPWMLIDYISFCETLTWKKKFNGEYAQYSFKGRNFHLLKPHTFINRSGKSVQACVCFFKLKPETLLVVHDDTELPFNEFRFKTGGGLAGHNGLRNLAQSLGSHDFLRIRLGISKPSHGNLASYVLSAFSLSENNILPQYLTSAANALERCLIEGFNADLSS